ncbi:hypothetical protein JM83_2100 [Gillisia sp. Hel_I_86]|nr:hypothetical protein JM83_2100 [Gillisia sp. Hel_I_86]
MKNHWSWMVVGCGLSLLFIFLAPSIWIGCGTELFIFIILMFAIHLMIPMKHGKYTPGLSEKNFNRKDTKSEHIVHHH